MFKNIKELIETRIDNIIVDDHLFNEDNYFIKINKENLQILLFFLKNDPDMKLSLFDQIIVIKSGILPWLKPENKEGLLLLYQLKSIFLPYRVTVCVELSDLNESLLSVAKIFPGAKWNEEDIHKKFGINFELEA